MVDFVNKLDTSYQKYQTNENVRYENYKGNLSYPMKDFVSFGTDFQLMYFMSTISLKYKINGFRVPQFQLDCIYDTTHPLNKNVVKLCNEVNYVWWVK